MKTNKTKFITKIISCFLCTAITLQAGLALTGERVNAAGIEFSESDDGYRVYLSNSDDNKLTIAIKAGEEEGYNISYDDPDTGEKIEEHFDKIGELLCYGNVNVVIASDVELGTVELSGHEPVFNILSGYTLKCEYIYGTCFNLTIDGTLECNKFKASDLYCDAGYSIEGSIVAKEIDLSQSCPISDDKNTKYIVNKPETTFINGTEDLDGTVIADADTSIQSGGGSFNLKVGELTNKITGAVSGKASEFVVDPGITLDDVPNILVGEKHDFSTCIHTASGYTGTPYLEFSTDNGSTWSTTEPIFDSEGEYHVRAVAPASGVYAESHTAAQLYKVTFLKPSDINEGQCYTFGNVVNGNYVPGEVKVVPASGYQISFYGGDYVDYVMVAKDDIIDPYDNYYSHIYFRFKNTNNNAVTAQMSPADNTGADFKELIIDTDNPSFEAYIIDPEDIEREVSVDEKGAIIEADELMVYVSDDNLSTVLLTIDGTQKDVSDKIVEGTCEINLTGMKDAQSIKITATDYANRVSVAEFYLVKELEPVTVTLTDMPAEVYYGQDLSIAFDGKITVEPEDYDGEPYFEYSTDGEIFSETASTGGTFWVRAVAPKTTTYAGGVSEAKKYTRTFLPITAVSTTGNLYTLEGMKNGKYITDSVTMVAPEGFMISTNLTNIGDFYKSIKITDEDILSGDLTALSNLQIYFKRISDGAYTNAVGVSNAYGVNPNFSNLVLDKTDPVIDNAKADGVATSITDKCTIVADSLSFRIYDLYLDSVVVDGKEYEITETYGSRYINFAFESTPLEPQTITVYAVDFAGRELDISFTLAHTPIDPTRATVTIGEVFYGEDYEPVVDTDSDGEKTIYYRKNIKGISSAILDEKPTEPGTYIVFADIAATDNYNATSCSAEFEIKKAIPTITFNIPDEIYAGESYVIDVETNSNGEKSTRFYYDQRGSSIVNDSVFFEEPDWAGKFMVVVQISETAFYEAGESTEYFTVKPKRFEATVTVDDITYGGDVNPVLDGVPEDYDGEAVYEYKLSTDPDTAYSTTVPEAAGTYDIRVTFPETDYYSSSTCSDTFTINSIDFEPEVTVADIYVNGTVTPVLEGVPEDYNGTINYQYKLNTDSEYSSAVPESAGTYTLLVTFSETAKYSSASCSDTFTISKYDVTATVSVDDLYVGDSITPKITITPNDYNGNITYQYKPSTSEDSAYTTTAPTTAGVYTVMAILEPTDKYSGTSCTDTFTISKIELDPTLTVSNIYVGETVTPVWDGIPDDYDGTITFVYIDGNGNSYSAEPLPAGNYLVRATIPETDKYERAVCETDLEVRKNDITDAKVTIENIKVGQTPAPVVTGVPDDYDGTITFAYIDGNGNSFSGGSLPAGSYLVRVTIPETDKYEKKVLETNLEVRKNDITGAKVIVENIKVGQTPAPVVAGLPDDYDKDLITYEYIDSEGNSRPADSLAAGNYLVSAIIPETDKYERAFCETDLVVSRYDITDAKVTVEDIVIGQTPSPSVTGVPEDYDGSIAFEYKLSTAPDTAYSSTVPAEPGTYSVLAIIPETDVYTGTSVSDIFIISKNEVSATVSVADITYGGTVKPVVTTDPADYDGSITYEYKVSTDPDTAYSSTVPVDAGTYTVRATLSTTEQFLGTTCTDSFEIKKKEITATVSVADVVIGETIKPVVTTISDGTPVFEYKASSAPDSDYSSAVPTAAGTYTVRATIPETKNYLGTTCTDDFKITKKVVTATVKVADITVGQKPSPVVTTESDGKDKATFEYKASSAPDSAFSSAVPTAKGTYTVRATIPETDTYEKIVCSASFEIKLNPVNIMDLSVPDTYAGLAVKATFNTDSDGTVTIMYKASGASDTAYSAAAPKEVGSYVARASVSETAKYEAAECTANFRIVYLEAPATPFVMSGTTGKNGYYTSDVVLNAPAGYTISTTFGTGYSASVPYTEGLTSIYLKRNDGALTGAISIGNAPKIDKVAPSITSSSGSISNGSVVYTSGLTIGANDPHLASLTVNGQSVNPATGMTLTPGMWIKTFTITAEDEAGNVTTISITLKAQWLENKILPADVELPLPTNEVFYFGEGQWIVTKIVKGEKIVDPTVYNGNTPFYVDSAADSYYVTLVT